MIVTLATWARRYWCVHSKRKNSPHKRVLPESLEQRHLLTVAGFDGPQVLLYRVDGPEHYSTSSEQTANSTSDASSSTDDSPDATPLPADWVQPHELAVPRDNSNLHPLSAIPALNSDPSASVNVYLDFNGNVQDQWGSIHDIVTPAFSLDKDTSTFSDAELNAIREIFERVAEDYAPFNVNVTTVEPPVIGDGNGVRVAIGGRYQDWYHSPAGGVAFVDNFTNNQANIVFVFAATLGNAKSIAEASAHEAGHAFGLQHQSQYDSSGKKIAEYYTGDSTGAPIMGVSYTAVRSRWWLGTSSTALTTQDDLAILSRPENGFGYRADDHGDDYATATPLTFADSQAAASGIIETMDDVDVFRFDVTQSDQFRINYHAAEFGADLDAHIELRTAAGDLIDQGTTFHQDSLFLGESLAAGSYQILIRNDGTYGSLGQYTLKVSSGDDPSLPPAAPANFAGQLLSPTSVQFNWNDTLGEDHYLLFATHPGDRQPESFSVSLPANATSYLLTDHGELTGWKFELRAVNSVGVTSSEAITPAEIPVTAPQNVQAQTFAADSLAVLWDAVPGALTYQVSIATTANPNKTVLPVKSVDGTRTEVILSGLQAGADYLITVTARNSLGQASQTPIHAQVVANSDAPELLPPDQTSGNATQPFTIHLHWADFKGAILFDVQQRQGKEWVTVKVVTSNTQTVDVMPEGDQTKATFRIVASNGSSTAASKPFKVRRPAPAWQRR